MSKLIKNFNILILFIGMMMLLSFPSEALATNTSNRNPTVTVSGTVTSETGEPLVAVSIAVKDAAGGATTDEQGKYSIEVEPQGTLIFSYVGYETQEVKVDSRTTVDIMMIEDAQVVDEVVVVGYGTQRKSHLTGSISKVKNENLDQIPIARVDDALVGQVAGVNIQMTNPAAGEAPTIRVRGQGSISFDSNPLIVLDGIVVGSDADFLASLDMNDVASVEILKDAASAAIYGSRGANGIIMITTKDSKEGPIQLNYDAYVGFKSVPESGVLTTVDDWMDFVRANNDGNLTDRFEYIDRLGTYTDWEDVMMDGGMIQSHAISARGGTKNTKFNMSASFLNDEGVLLTDNYEKLNFRLNVKTKVNKRITFGTTINPSYVEQRRFPIGVHDALRQSAWLPLYLDENNIQYVNRHRENGRWADAQIGDYAMERMFDDYDLVADEPSTGSGTDISSTSNQSSLAKVLERDRRKKQTKVYANTYLRLKLADGLHFKQVVGGDFRTTANTTWIGVNATRNGAGDSEARLSTNNRLHSVFESILTYNKDFGEHSLSAVAGYAYEKWNWTTSLLAAAGFEFDYIQTIPAANLIEGETDRYEEALQSYFSRFNYVFADKYLVSLSARWDGSSKFGPDNKFGFFPAISVGWNVAREGFMEDVDLFDQFKVRFSYGNSGSNSGIGQYDYIGLISPVGTGIGGVGTGFNPLNISNSQLRWEKLVETNFGLDVAIFDGRISGSIDIYDRTSDDLLLNLPIPSVTGFQSALVNRGTVQNRGFELELRSNNYRTDNFSWSTTGILTRNVNTLVDFAGSSGLISTVDSKRPAEWIALEGQPIASYYGYVVSHEIDPQYIRNPFYPINAQSQDIYVKDINGDGLIDTDDRTILGSPYPDFIWTINNNLRFGDFDVSFMFQGSQGAEIRNISSQYINNEFSSNQDYTSDFPDADQVVQRIFTNDDIQDASYIALRNVNIGYTFTNKVPFLNRARVYVGAQNLLYIMADGYVGYNPEGIDQGLGNPLTWGYQRGPAPIYRTVSFGLNATF
jgi:TonB-linked SusC/RagA family outer membrane protein